MDKSEADGRMFFYFVFLVLSINLLTRQEIEIVFQSKEINLSSSGYLSQFIKFKSTYSRLSCLLTGPEKDLWSGQRRDGGCQLFGGCKPR